MASKLRFLKNGLMLLAFGFSLIIFANQPEFIAQPEYFPEPELEEDARAIFLKSIEKSRTTPLTLVQNVRYFDSSYMVFKVETDRAGAKRSVILQPLNFQGIVWYEDDRQWVAYHPDQKVATVFPPVSHLKSEPRKRLMLITKNYDLRVDKPQQVAGRKTLTVLATPREKDLPTRRYAFDLDTYVILRMEALATNKPPITLVDTYMVRPANSSRKVQSPLEKNGVTSKRIEVKRLDSVMNAKEVLGFELDHPNDLPYGFMLSDANVILDKNSPMMTLALTDGLIWATANIWSDKKIRPCNNMPPVNFKNERGVCVALLGDLPDRVRQVLAEHLLRSKRMEDIRKDIFTKGNKKTRSSRLSNRFSVEIKK